MNCLKLNYKSVYLILSLILNKINCFLYPICTRNENGCEGESTNETNVPYTFMTIISRTFNCVLCTIFSYIKIIFYDMVSKMNLMYHKSMTYKYKPPPSLFETIAIWTGTIKEDEDDEDDKLWEAQKLFMLASMIILSMVFLHYGQIWFNKYEDIPEFENYKICKSCRKYLPNSINHTSTVSPSVSFVTCTCEQEVNI